MMEALSSSETLVLIRATWHNIPEDAILQSHLRENLNSYFVKLCCIVFLVLYVFACDILWPTSCSVYLDLRNMCVCVCVCVCVCMYVCMSVLEGETNLHYIQDLRWRVVNQMPNFLGWWQPSGMSTYSTDSQPLSISEGYCLQSLPRTSYAVITSNPDNMSSDSVTGVERSPVLLRPFIGLSYLAWITHDNDCGVIGGMKAWQGNWSSRRKPAQMLLCSPQIPYELTQAQTQASMVGSQRLTAWAMVWQMYRVTIK
jgi:hypothetical protein